MEGPPTDVRRRILLWIGAIHVIVVLVLNFVPIGGSTPRWY